MGIANPRVIDGMPECRELGSQSEASGLGCELGVFHPPSGGVAESKPDNRLKIAAWIWLAAFVAFGILVAQLRGIIQR
jgi:hypothetical protein